MECSKPSGKPKLTTREKERMTQSTRRILTRPWKSYRGLRTPKKDSASSSVWPAKRGDSTVRMLTKRATSGYWSDRLGNPRKPAAMKRGEDNLHPNQQGGWRWQTKQRSSPLCSSTMAKTGAQEPKQWTSLNTAPNGEGGQQDGMRGSQATAAINEPTRQRGIRTSSRSEG